MYTIDDMISDIKLGIKNNEDLDYFEKIYRKSWQLVKWHGITIENNDFYRARFIEKNRLFDNIEELKYPPYNIVKERGRFNDVNESMGYLSTGTLAPWVELDADYYQIMCMAELDFVVRDIIFFTIGVKGEYTAISEEELKFIEFFNKILTTPNKKYYNATIAFSHRVFNGGLKVSKESNISLPIGILYNSAQESKTNKHLHNIVIKPQDFDRCFKFKKASYQLMAYRKEENAIEMVTINEGTILTNGLIKWQRDFNEMMNYCNNLFSEHVFLSNDENGDRAIIKYKEGSGKVYKEDDKYYYVKFKNYENLIKVDKEKVVI